MREYSIGVTQGLDPSLPTEHIDRLAGAGRPVCFAKGAMLYRQREAAAHCYLLTSGRVNTFLVNARGHESLLRIHLPGSILGLTALATRPIRDASAVTVEASEAVEISRDNIVALFHTVPGFGEHVVRMLVDRMSDFHYRVGDLMSRTVEQRLVTALLALSQPDAPPASQAGSGIVTLTHEQIAHLINARRPTVSAVLGRLADAGLIARTGRSILVTDREGLARLSPDPEVS